MSNSIYVYVIAGNMDEFHTYTTKRTVDEIKLCLPQSTFVYVDNNTGFVHNPKGIFYGSWIKRNDLGQVFFRILRNLDVNSEQYETVNILWAKWVAYHYEKHPH